MGKIKKLIWFHPQLGMSGGGERLILEGVKYFESVGIVPHLLVFKFEKKAIFDGAYNPEVIQLFHDNKVPSANFFLKVTSYVSKTLALILLLRKKVKEISPDVIISQGQFGQDIPIYLALLFTPFPRIVNIFGSNFPIPDEYSNYALIFRRHFNEIRESVEGYSEVLPVRAPRIGLVRRLRVELNALLKYFSVRNARKVFVLSNQSRWEVKKLYNKDAVVLRGGFSNQLLNYEPRQDIKKKLGLSDKKVILNINRLSPSKRVDLCIRAFGELSNRIKDAVLVIGGIGEDEVRLKDIVRQLALESRVRFIGYIKENELWDYYACCDVFVHLHLTAFAIVPLEALALGKKVVWPTEMETDEFLAVDRFLFPAKPKVMEIAKVLEKALTTELPPMTSTEKRALSHYTWDSYFGRMLSEIEKALT